MKLIIPNNLPTMAIMKFLLLLLVILSSSCISSIFMDALVYPKWMGYLFWLSILLIFSSFFLAKKKYITTKISIMEFWGVILLAFLVIISQIQNYSLDALLIPTSGILLYFFFKVFSNHISQELIDLFFILSSFFPIYFATGQFFKSIPIIEGTYDSPTGLAFSVILAIISLSNLITKKSTNKQLILYIALITVCTLILFASNSRAGLLSAFIIFFVFFMKKYKKIVSIVFCGLILFSIFNFKTESSKGRWFIYSTTLSMLDTPKHICFGYGHDGFKKKYMLQQAINLKAKSLDTRQRADNIKHPLNEFLLLLINYGGPFFLFFIVGIVALLSNVILDKPHTSFFVPCSYSLLFLIHSGILLLGLQ